MFCRKRTRRRRSARAPELRESRFSDYRSGADAPRSEDP